jgi:hypothetical protein
MITTSKAGGPASEAPAMETKGRSVLDTPQEPVIGLAEGETRWRGMTAFGGDTPSQLPRIAEANDDTPRAPRAAKARSHI